MCSTICRFFFLSSYFNNLLENAISDCKEAMASLILGKLVSICTLSLSEWVLSAIIFLKFPTMRLSTMNDMVVLFIDQEDFKDLIYFGKSWDDLRIFGIRRVDLQY